MKMKKESSGQKQILLNTLIGRMQKKTTLPKLKPSTKTISLRLPEFILDELKLIAHKREVPYQSLIKFFLKERIDLELKHLVK